MDEGYIPAPEGALVRAVPEQGEKDEVEALRGWVRAHGYLYVVESYEDALDWNVCKSLATGKHVRFFTYELQAANQEEETDG